MEGLIIIFIFTVVALYGDEGDFLHNHISLVISMFLLVTGAIFFDSSSRFFKSYIDWHDLMIGISGNLICSIVTVVFVKYYFDQSQKSTDMKYELDKIMRFNRIVHILRGKYVRYYNILVTPMEKFNNVDFNNMDMEIKKNFEFSDLKDLYQITMLVNDDYQQPRIDRFYEIEELLVKCFRNMVENIDFTFFPEVREILISFINISLLYDNRNVVRGNEKMMMGDKKMTDVIAEYISNKEKYQWVQKIDKGELPGNMMIPYVLLFEMLQEERDLLRKYDEFIAKHMTKD